MANAHGQKGPRMLRNVNRADTTGFQKSQMTTRSLWGPGTCSSPDMSCKVHSELFPERSNVRATLLTTVWARWERDRPRLVSAYVLAPVCHVLMSVVWYLGVHGTYAWEPADPDNGHNARPPTADLRATSTGP